MTNDDRIKMITTAGAAVRHFKRELDSEGEVFALISLDEFMDEHGIVRGTITI
ncbi:MAG: hypothetical protein J6Z43_03560 [Clostridiales bacterium]|nr:hypothetical protein [Clostridiales bacterium]